MRLLLITGITASAIPAGAGNAAPSADTPHSDFSEPKPARVALVIGNAGYGQQSLRTPQADARALSQELAALGFDVATLEDATQAGIRVAFDEFERRLRGADLGLFYFAGHAVQLDGSALLLPVDTQIGSPASLRGVDLHDIVARMSSGDSGRTSLILVDACLTDPFADGRASAAPPALVATLPERTLVAFASAPGGVAFDGADDQGVFTDELLKLLPRAGLPLAEVFGRVQREVWQRTG
ncbi:MAG: caspase family protein, partial [Thiohalobacteraceae bacterium]